MEVDQPLSSSGLQRYVIEGGGVGVLTQSQTGHSVLLHVTDFLHYLYIAAPVSFTKQDCDGFRTYLDSQIGQHQPAIHSVQMVLRSNLMKFQGNQPNPYLKITVTDPKHINKVRSMLESGERGLSYKGFWKGIESGILTFDSIQYVLRFMIDTGVSKKQTYPDLL